MALSTTKEEEMKNNNNNNITSSPSVKLRNKWVCRNCTEENPMVVSECSLCRQQRPSPPLLIGALAVSSIMIVCSGFLTFTLTSQMNNNEDVRELLSVDARSIENVGHAGLLVIFTGMYWLSGKLYCWYMVRLSMVFMLLVSGFTSCTVCYAKYLRYRETSYVTLFIPLAYFSACLIGCFTLSFDVDGKHNFKLFSSKRKDFPPGLLVDDHGKCAKSVRIPNPTMDNQKVQYWTKWLRRCLLCRVVFMTICIAIRGVISIVIVYQTNSQRSINWLNAVPFIQSFVQSYTMVFHQCFILSTGFAAMMRLDDCIEMYGHGSMVFGCYNLIQSIKYGMMVLQNSVNSSNHTNTNTVTSCCDRWWLICIECLLSSILHFTALIVCILIRKHTIIQSTNVGKPSRQWRMPRPTIFSLRSWRAKFLAFSATSLAIIWQSQCIFMVYNVSKDPEVDGDDPSNNNKNVWGYAKQIDTFNQSINFGLHGAAFFLFHTVLSFQSVNNGYKRLRELHIMAGLATGSYSLSLMLHLLYIRGVHHAERSDNYIWNHHGNSGGGSGVGGMNSNTNSYNLVYLIGIRSIICFLYGFAFMLYNTDHLKIDVNDYIQYMEKKHPYCGIPERDDNDNSDDNDDGELCDSIVEEKYIDTTSPSVEIELTKKDDNNEDEQEHLLISNDTNTNIETSLTVSSTLSSASSTSSASSAAAPTLIIRQIQKYSQCGIYSVIVTGIVWSIYVILINIQITEKPQHTTSMTSPMILSKHRVGYGITFHVSYLLTLFAFDGYYSGNLITLDVGRNFSISTLLVYIPMCVLVFNNNYYDLYSMMFVIPIGPIFLIAISILYTKISMFWSLDPLEGWKR
jgi:hypothetical protein